jgi:hypothetical protein
MAFFILLLAALALIGLIFYFFYWLQSRTYPVFKRDLESFAKSLGLDLVEQKNPKWAYFNGLYPFLRGNIKAKSVLIFLISRQSSATNSSYYSTEIKISCAIKNEKFLFCPSKLFPILAYDGLKKVSFGNEHPIKDWTFGVENEHKFSTLISESQFWEKYVLEHEVYWRLEKGFLTSIVRNFPNMNSNAETFASLLKFGLELSDKLSKSN